MLRLSRARRALLSADCELVTVTEIVTYFGFVELGPFQSNTERYLVKVRHKRCTSCPELFPPPTGSAILLILASARDDAGVCGIYLLDFQRRRFERDFGATGEANIQSGLIIIHRRVWCMVTLSGGADR
jgi:hypothetical protein